jgi:hypothetical protein
MEEKMKNINYDGIAKFLWPIVAISISALLFYYFINETPERLVTSIIPILIYFILVITNRNRSRGNLAHFPSSIMEYLLIINSFLIGFILLILFVINDYFFIKISYSLL